MKKKCEKKSFEFIELRSDASEQIYRCSLAVVDCHWSYVLPGQVDHGSCETVGGACGGATGHFLNSLGATGRFLNSLSNQSRHSAS